MGERGRVRVSAMCRDHRWLEKGNGLETPSEFNAQGEREKLEYEGISGGGWGVNGNREMD